MKKRLSLALVVLLCLLSACSIAEGLTFADTIAWNGEYDVIVVGFGASGASAAISAAESGVSVLVTEKAPKGEAGGNSRVADQLFISGEGDVEGTLNYLKALANPREIPEEVLQVYAEGIANICDVTASLTGLEKSQFVIQRENATEFPELGDIVLKMYAAHESRCDAFLYSTLRDRVYGFENTDVWYDSPATHLIQDPVTKAILGVTIDRNGEEVHIKANNGVVLACGGFENNPTMVADYLGVTDYIVTGSLYNTGDGIHMAQEVGADLWHMNVFERSSAFGGGLTFVTDGDGNADATRNAALFNGSIFIVGSDGSRYVREDYKNRHGKVPYAGTWTMVVPSERIFFIYDQVQADLIAEKGAIEENYRDRVIVTDTIAELASKINANPDTLEATFNHFNEFAKNGEDLQLGRSAESMTALSEDGPYYAMEAYNSLLNTQGGPRRNENAEVLDTQGNPIPHLYSAGELGGVTAHFYQGAGNLAECLIFGQVAGRNAAEKKNDVVSVPLTVAEDDIRFVLGAVDDAEQNGIDLVLNAGEYLGVSHAGIGGDIYVIVAMDGGNIVDVKVVGHNETPGIGTAAIDAIPSAIISAGSIEVDSISGATVTSKAIKAAVEDALSQAK